MTAAKPTGEETVTEALASSQGELTGAEIAVVTRLGRSTVGKTLAALERAGMARRQSGGRQGRRRLPDRWSAGSSDERSPAEPPTQRLRPGQLDGLVLDFLNTQGEDTALGATAVAKALGRSAGAVGNCLARLAAAGQVRQVTEQPRRYSSTTPTSSKRGRTRRSRNEES
jgi:DNA-binding transcriptional ArsR family regulator